MTQAIQVKRADVVAGVRALIREAVKQRLAAEQA
jgi:hypothetical protein